jgi:16S rRNA (guanine527-N7)-methyltransferase
VVHARRIEDCGDSFGDKIDVASARALAPLKVLCDQAFPLIAKGAVGLFPKGQDVAAELTDAAKYWRIAAETVPSRTSSEGCIVVIRRLERLKS